MNLLLVGASGFWGASFCPGGAFPGRAVPKVECLDPSVS